MDLILAGILLIGVFAALGYPLYRARPRVRVSGGSPLGDLLAQRDGLYATLRDLDLDFQLGKLDEADYRGLREKYLSRAATVLHEIDAFRSNSKRSALDDGIEREVAALRRTSAGNGRPAGERVCSNCGRPFQNGDLFCGKCGQALS
ncbi:MAG: hypothetical protein ACM3JD_09850 [Rudaea sp.]